MLLLEYFESSLAGEGGAQTTLPSCREGDGKGARQMVASSEQLAVSAGRSQETTFAGPGVGVGGVHIILSACLCSQNAGILVSMSMRVRVRQRREGREGENRFIHKNDSSQKSK